MSIYFLVGCTQTSVSHVSFYSHIDYFEKGVKFLTQVGCAESGGHLRRLRPSSFASGCPTRVEREHTRACDVKLAKLGRKIMCALSSGVLSP